MMPVTLGNYIHREDSSENPTERASTCTSSSRVQTAWRLEDPVRTGTCQRRGPLCAAGSSPTTNVPSPKYSQYLQSTSYRAKWFKRYFVSVRYLAILTVKNENHSLCAT